MQRKWQKYLALIVIVLVVLLIAVKVAVNHLSGSQWEPDDRAQMIADCIDDLGGYAVRFPTPSEEYCSCTTDTIMHHYSKAEYLLIEQGKDAKGEKELLTVLSECYNTYQQEMFKRSKLD